MTQSRRALLAVADKTGITDFAARLTQLQFEIISTGGTARTLRDAGIPVRDVSDVTRFPEMLGGRVKTLHPMIHGGILARRDLEEDLAALREHQITPIDLVVVNLYPFEEKVAAGAQGLEAIEEIDIGGPTLIRAAAKNHAHTAVVVSPDRYQTVGDELENSGSISEATRAALALEAFQRTAAYDAAISNWMGRQHSDFPSTHTEQWHKMGELRYGENPHQAAAWYRRDDGGDFSLAHATIQGGKAISYNNLLDGAAAIECAKGLNGPGAVVIKHCIPCGAAEHDDLEEAFRRAVAGDSLSAFGGILAFNEPVTAALAAKIATPDHFFEVIHAPKFEDGAIQAIVEGAKWGKNCRIIEGGAQSGSSSPWEVRSIPGAVLVQGRDQHRAQRDDFRVVTQRQPTDEEWRDLLFAWRVVPFVRSNAILLASNRAVVGVGSGQPSRVDAVLLACRKAGERAQNSVLASDAFFPFPDGVESAASAGVRAVIQPGGSIRDESVIAAADAADMALVLTSERHFRH